MKGKLRRAHVISTSTEFSADDGLPAPGSAAPSTGARTTDGSDASYAFVEPNAQVGLEPCGMTVEPKSDKDTPEDPNGMSLS